MLSNCLFWMAMCQRRDISGELLESAESCVAAVSTEKAELASSLQYSYIVLKFLSAPS